MYRFVQPQLGLNDVSGVLSLDWKVQQKGNPRHIKTSMISKGGNLVLFAPRSLASTQVPTSAEVRGCMVGSSAVLVALVGSNKAWMDTRRCRSFWICPWLMQLSRHTA